MNLRTALLVATLALAATALRAEELQWTISGVADCPIESLCTGQPTTGPGTITFDLNTLDATLTPAFANNPPGGPPGDVLTSLSVSFPLTNYSAIVNGQTIGFAAHGSGSFRCFGPFDQTVYQCDGSPPSAFPPSAFSPSHGPGAFSFLDNETWIHTLTEAQYKALQDPLASILLSDTSPPRVPCAEVLCFMEQGPGNSVYFFSRFTVVRVPTPGPLPLFLAGLVVGALSLRGRKKIRRSRALGRHGLYAA